MKKFFAALMLATILLSIGCGNTMNNESNNTQKTQPKAEQKIDESSVAKSKSNKSEIDRLYAEWLEEFTVMNYRLEKLRKVSGKNSVSTAEMDRFVSETRKELDKLNFDFVNYVEKLKEKEKSVGVSKYEIDKFVAETRDRFDSLGVTVAKVEAKVGL